jgi:zinc protease
VYRFPLTLGTIAALCLACHHLAALHAAEGTSQDAIVRTAAALYEGIRTETLPNGLRVYLKPLPGSQVVTTIVAYKVGSADEELDQTGLSHYLEHLMFKGTDKIMPGDIDRVTLRHGGANNAYTSEDMTVYHFDFAAAHWERALEIEAERMRNLRIDAKHEFEQEKGAVIEELQRNEDEPWDLEYKAILPLLFGKGTPYGHPVIGQREHVRGATAAIIKAHYDKWYHPNNAALVVCGQFDPDRALTKIKSLFGPIPKATLPPRKPVPKLQWQRPGPRKELVSKFEVPRLLMGFGTVASNHPDDVVLDVIEAVLAGGKTSRLYKKLVEGEEVANMVDATSSVGRYPGWFSIQVELLKGKDRSKTEKLVRAELRRMQDEPVSDAELKRVRQTVLASFVFGREGVHGLADSIAQGVTVNDLDYLKNYLPRVMAVTAADVQRVARKYFGSQRGVDLDGVVVWSVPPQPKRDDSQSSIWPWPQSGTPRAWMRWAWEAPTSHALHVHVQGVPPFGDQGVPPSRSLRRAAQSPGSDKLGAGFSLKDARRVELPNGLVLLLLENRRLPIFVASALVRRGRLLEPEDKAGVAALMGSLLEEGTARHTGPQISELIEDVGGSLSLGSSGGTVKVLSAHRQMGLELLLECMTRPTFPKDAFARQKSRQLSEVDEAERLPDTKAQMVYRQLAYGKHPYGRPSQGKRSTVEPLTAADCAEFHRRLFAPNNTILAVVGDFDSRQIIDEVTRLTAAWKKTPVRAPTAPAVEKPKEFVQKIVTMPEAAQLHFYMGHVGIRRNNPDYFKLLVMDYVLGTGPGFTDRLSSRLRDREGLAYTVTANISGSAAEEPGLFTCYIGTDPKNFARVKALFLEELGRIRQEKPKLEEVEDVKKYLLGRLPFQLTTNEQIAGQLLSVEHFGLGLDYFDTYRKAVAAVTPDDVQAVAQKYLDPRRMVLVAAGAVDEAGKVLRP